ncbi:MAG: hypothetical protein Q4P78_07280 [Rothia sp. (in: high G+C Gram-positive bacteria)]|uniref:hypothetical protein n=1 Tax=Rothia sp. (in: high G+C Gram-positive bacteria) TaxID=1885016 RepID=UPI0026E0ACDA|nr:hypothetical protein [Rothia sp. (in: high G+C Gram-positive bacteria)]MDO5750984.1 hypothetical protein [Rothia sp. (in: high G+C Gram-positive bacteria)]
MRNAFAKAATATAGAALTLTMGFSAVSALPPGGASSNTPGTSSSASMNGDVITFELKGFPENTEVNVKIDDGSLCPADAPQGACVVYSMNTDSSGTARASFTLNKEYLDQLSAGSHTLRFLASKDVAGKGTQPYSNKSPEFTYTPTSRPIETVEAKQEDTQEEQQTEAQPEQSTAAAEETTAAAEATTEAAKTEEAKPSAAATAAKATAKASATAKATTTATASASASSTAVAAAENTSDSNGSSSLPWILGGAGVLIAVGAGVFLYLRNRKEIS